MSHQLECRTVKMRGVVVISYERLNTTLMHQGRRRRTPCWPPSSHPRLLRPPHLLPVTNTAMRSVRNMEALPGFLAQPQGGNRGVLKAGQRLAHGHTNLRGFGSPARREGGRCSSESEMSSGLDICAGVRTKVQNQEMGWEEGRAKVTWPSKMRRDRGGGIGGRGTAKGGPGKRYRGVRETHTCLVPDSKAGQHPRRMWALLPKFRAVWRCFIGGFWSTHIHHLWSFEVWLSGVAAAGRPRSEDCLHLKLV